MKHTSIDIDRECILSYQIYIVSFSSLNLTNFCLCPIQYQHSQLWDCWFH